MGNAVAREGANHSGNARIIQTRLAAASRYNRWIHDLLDPYVGRRVLDAGCGLGNITQFFLDREYVLAAELREDFCQYMREHFAGNANLRVVQADLTDPRLRELRSERLDTVICINVLEHLEDDVMALRNFAGLLEPDGCVVLFTPALPCLYGTMDAADDHRRRYTRQDLARKLEDVGLAVVHQRWVNLPGIAAWWLNGKVLRKPLVSEGNYGLFDHLVPAIAVGERLIEPPIGLSILSIARKEPRTD